MVACVKTTVYLDQFDFQIWKEHFQVARHTNKRKRYFYHMLKIIKFTRIRVGKQVKFTEETLVEI